MDNQIRSVSQITGSIKALLEDNFPFIWVRGQVANLSRPSSGHLYFSLKDAESALDAVWFAGRQKSADHFDPLTGEVFEDGPRPGLSQMLEDGQEIICAGRIGVYAARGRYQLLVELALSAGQGALQLEFERVKARLADRGYFEQERKRPLPRHPLRVAVITALTGAALQDFLRIAREKGVGAEIRIHPVPVQGEAAPAAIAAALEAANASGWAEVAVLIRGGGAAEDLQAFNSEIVAHALFRSAIPTLAGIGHEVDISIADLVADCRASTPTHAAQLLWQDAGELAQRLDDLNLLLHNYFLRGLERSEGRLAHFVRALAWLSPVAGFERRAAELALFERRAALAFGHILEAGERRLFFIGEERLGRAARSSLEKRANLTENLAGRLEALNPLGPLEMGYALVRREDGSCLRSAGAALRGEKLALVLHDGEVITKVE